MPSPRTAIAIASLIAFAAWACSTAAQPIRQQTADDVVATVGGARITLGEVDARALTVPAANFGNLPLAQALYEARRAVLDEMIGNRLIDGDASYLMHLAEFETAVRYKMPLLVVVMNNQCLGAEYYKLDAKKMDAMTSVIPTPDLGAVAVAMGGRGALVTHNDQLRGAVKEWVAKPGPQTDRAHEMVKAFIARNLSAARRSS